LVKGDFVGLYVSPFVRCADTDGRLSWLRLSVKIPARACDHSLVVSHHRQISSAFIRIVANCWIFEIVEENRWLANDSLLEIAQVVVTRQ